MAVTATVTRNVTAETGVELDTTFLNSLGLPNVVVDSISATSVTLENLTVSTMPTNGTTGRVVYVSDGDGGIPCLAVDNGTLVVIRPDYYLGPVSQDIEVVVSWFRQLHNFE